ncbi:MAG: hypothetical protein U0175_31045 [Caldilineaceae bacterium]
MNTPNHSFQRAIVIGGSMTGLFAARILSDFFEEVTILERDLLPTAPVARRGIPQAKHAHVLLTRGQQILDQLFPGIEDTLRAKGAVLIDWSQEGRLYSAAGWAAPQHSNLQSYGCSRELLEWLVRSRVQQIANVRFQSECRVEELILSPERDRVIGANVTYLNIPEVGTKSDMLEADLIVDASGRTSRLPQWLEELGFPQIQESTVSSSLGYATRWYEKPTGFKADWKGVLVAARPPHLPRGGVVLATEGNRWVVTLSGYNSDYPPTDEAGFTEFMKSLATPYLYEVVKDARPLTSIYGYQRTDNCWHHYETAKLPDGVVALGDAVCAFNPVYGQGMTMGALGALTLQHTLQSYRNRQTLQGMTSHFQKQLAKNNQIAWALATGEDFRWPGTTGQRSGSLRVMHAYVGQLQQLLATDPEVAQLFWSVAHLVTPPTAMFSPKMIFKVLSHKFTSRFNNNPSTHTSPPLHELASAPQG